MPSLMMPVMPLIATALERNDCLVELFMYNNPLTGEGMVNIVNGLKVNNTLAELHLPKCPEDVIKKRIISLQELINKNRESRGCQVKLRIVVASPTIII